ncbi:tyrosine-type recombinase/integrase [Xanthomonas fragariae]|uniref:Prophage CPS-53 integrase n=1 Tax=Xanthomonas fragariae TaxID=48664 RepID=A0ABY1RS37_9XANT|nr:integrase arm-type DNA-binding domain-containing protein [Xanthomonas fragariae]WIY71637.1 integrase arm-type DNA-binding domain-containing protein [Xanthomonas fragariae]SMR00126.1 putative prophage CPS-53 integrase [Xanthomonas fragariae]
MLTDMVVRQAKASDKPYTLADFDGLFLYVSPVGGKAWHFRYTWVGQRARISLGSYPELSLREAREFRDQARALVAKGINPRIDRKQKRQAIRLAGENTFMAVYEKWMEHRQLTLEEGRQSSLEQIRRVFKKDVFPYLKRYTIYEITRPVLLEVIGRIEKRESLSVAEKVRTWLKQLADYAMVVIPGMVEHPAIDLHVVAVPLPPVEHNPLLRMPELPLFLQTLRKYRGMQMTQLAIRLLLLTGVRTGELRLATPDQFDLEQGLWIIPVMSLKQRKMLTKKKRKRVTDIPPYIVPLPVQAIEIVRHMLDLFKPAQTYLFPGVKRITARMSENTVNRAIKRLGYDGRLTGHGIRATISTALNELGYPKVWVDAQLSHADPNRISATYNHAEYVEQRRLMMQDWADRLDLFEQNQVQIASTHLTIHLQGVPTIAGQKVTPLPALGQHAPIMLVAPNEQTMPAVGAGTQRLSAIQMPEYALPKISEVQRERLEVLDIFEGPDNLVVADYAKLAGKSRRWITYEIQARNLLSIQLGNKGQRVPVWQLNMFKRRLVQAVLKRLHRGVDTWDIYYALTRPREELDGMSPIEALTSDNQQAMVEAVCQAVSEATTPVVEKRVPINRIAECMSEF